MKKVILSAVVIPLFSFAAYAADLPTTKGPPVFAPPPPPPVFSWTGFYVGLNAGYGWDADPNVALNGLGGAGWDPYYPDTFYERSLSRSGFLGGGQAGYNYQITSFVVGAEADIQYSDINGSSFQGDQASGNASFYNLSLQQRLDWLGTVRGRVGFSPFDRLLVYATGGLAVGGLSATSDLDFIASTQYNVSSSQTRAGWTAGAGVEYAIDPNWSVKAEYLYYDLGTETLITYPSPNPPYNTRTDFRVNGNIVRAGVNYKFDLFAPPAPVVAKY